MKKFNKMILVGIISILVIVPTYSQGYSYSIGDKFDYKLVIAKEDLVLGNTIANFTGIRIGAINFPESSLFSFNITSIFSGGYIIERITNVTQDDHVYYNNQFLYCIDFLINYPVNMAYFFINEGQPAIDYYNVGIELACHPFIPLDVETWSSLKEFIGTYETYLFSHFGEEGISIDNYQYQVKENRKYNQIETFLRGSISDTTTTDFTFASSHKFAYSTESGALLGSRIKGNLKGLIENTTIDIVFDVHFEMLGFELKPFEIGDFTENASGYNIIQVASSIFLVFILPVILQKKKERKN